MLAWIYGNFLGLTKAHRQKSPAPRQNNPIFRTKIISASYSLFTEETTPSIKSMLPGGHGGMEARAALPLIFGKNHSIQLTILHSGS